MRSAFEGCLAHREDIVDNFGGLFVDYNNIGR